MKCKYIETPLFLGSHWYQCNKYNQIYLGDYSEDRCGNCIYLKHLKRKEKLIRLKTNDRQ
jgi:hypothetical protein